MPPPPQDPELSWWQHLVQEQEAEDPLEEEYEEPARFPPELFGQSWAFTTVPQLPQAPPTHLWTPPDYVVLSDEE